MRIHILVFAVSASLVFHSVAAWPTQHPLALADFPPTTIPKFVEDVRQRFGTQAFGLAIARKRDDGDGWDEYAGHFGTLNAQGQAVTKESMFSIASNSKLFTMLAVGLLVDNGTVLPNGETLDWSTKIKDILPEWQLMDEYASDHVDLIDLLSHRSGLPRHDESHGPNDSPSDVVAGMRYLRPSYEIRQKWQYNNQHYITLAHIVTTLSGKPFQDYVGEHILVPLRMEHTSYNSTWAGETGHRADGFIRTGRNDTICKERWNATSGNGDIDPSCLGVSKPLGWWTKTDGSFEAGAGGVITSPKDLVIWLRELLDPKVIPKHLIDLASRTVEVAEGVPTEPEVGIVTYGLAQIAWTYRGVNVVGHTGSFVGQRSLLIRVPDHNFALAVVTNDEDLGVPLLKMIAYKVIDELAGLSPMNWEKRVMGEWFNQKPNWSDIPANPSPPPVASDILGVYHDMGYGNLTMFPSRSLDASFTKIEDDLVPLNTTGPIYIAQINKAFVSHLVFTHYSGHLFNWTAVSLLPAIGPDRNETGEYLVSLQGVGSAILDGSGLGMFGNWWGGEGAQAARHAEEGKGAKDKANVWYDKISGEI